MARIQLRLYDDPGAAEVFVRIKRNDGTYETIIATVDTGAAVCLFPARILNRLVHRVIREKVILEPEGIARQEFEATEVLITLFLEDHTGAQTQDIEVRAWFTDTLKSLVGFESVLDSAVLHIDMLNTRSGYIEFADS